MNVPTLFFFFSLTSSSSNNPQRETPRGLPKIRHQPPLPQPPSGSPAPPRSRRGAAVAAGVPASAAGHPPTPA